MVVAAAVLASPELACRILRGLSLADLYSRVRLVSTALRHCIGDAAFWTSATVEGIQIWRPSQLEGFVRFLKSFGQSLRELRLSGIQASEETPRPDRAWEIAVLAGLGPADQVDVRLPLLGTLSLQSYSARGELAWIEWALGVFSCPGLRRLSVLTPMSANVVQGVAGLIERGPWLEEVQLHFTGHSKDAQGSPLQRLVGALLARKGTLKTFELQPSDGMSPVVWSPTVLSDAAPELLQSLLRPQSQLAERWEKSMQAADVAIASSYGAAQEDSDASGSNGLKKKSYKNLAVGYATDRMCFQLLHDDDDSASGSFCVRASVASLSLLSSGAGGQGLTPRGVGAMIRSLQPGDLESLRVRCEWDSFLEPSELDHSWFLGSSTACFSNGFAREDNSWQGACLGLPNLRQFNCFGMRWTGPLLRVLVRRCPALEAIRLHNIGGIDDAALKEIVTGCGSRLTSLSLRGRGLQISESGAKAIVRCRQKFGVLQHLELDTCRKMTKAAVVGLVCGLASLGCTALALRAWDPLVAVDNALAVWVCSDAPKSLIRFRCGLDNLERTTGKMLVQRFPSDFYFKENGAVRSVDDVGGLPIWDARANRSPISNDRGSQGSLRRMSSVDGFNADQDRY